MTINPADNHLAFQLTRQKLSMALSRDFHRAFRDRTMNARTEEPVDTILLLCCKHTHPR